MKLLIETSFNTEYEIIEEEKGKKSLYVTGIFSEVDIENNNGRVYPEAILAREVEKFQRLIESGQAIGELDHPESPKLNLRNISHRITKVWKEGKQYLGKAQILPTESGNIAKNLIESGVRLGISSRALGSLTQEEGYKKVNEDLHLITWDLVARPSFGNALMSSIYENKEYSIIEGKIVESVKSSAPKEEEVKYLLEEVKRWRDKYYSQLILDSLKKMSKEE